MAKTQVLRYWIHLTDPDLVATLNTELDAGGGPTVNPHGTIIVASGLDNGLNQAPDNASSDIAPELDPPGPAPIIAQGAAMQSPSVSSEWFTTEFNFPQDVATFTRKSGGWFGISLLFGTVTTFYWSGRFVYTPPGTAVTDTTGAVIASPAPIPLRYFVETFELPLIGNGASGTLARTSRDASGFTEGYGMAFRKSTGILDHQTYAYLAGGLADAPTATWDRLYYTLRARPTSLLQVIHSTQGFPTAGDGGALAVLPSGQLALYLHDLSLGWVLLGTAADALTIDQRTKIDILYNWGAGVGRIRVYVSGVLTVDSGVTASGPGGTTTSQVYTLSQTLGALVPTRDETYEADVDYWHCAEIPNKAGVESLTSIDWLQGSRGVLLEANGQAADFSAVGWTASKYRSLSRRPAARVDSQLASTTALSIASFTVDVQTRVRNIRQAVGMVSMVVGLYSFRGTTSGRLGYKLNAGADTWASITQVAGPNPSWNTTLYRGPNTALPLTPTALEIKHEKGNDATAGGIQLLAACVELVGIFGAEDLPADARDQAVIAGFNPRAGVHNSAYPDTPWGGGIGADPSFGALAIFSGTYTGNGTTQDIALKHAPCFVLVRRVSGATDVGAWWTTALLGAHIDIEQGTNPAITCLRDPAYAGATALDERELGYLLRIGNNHAQVNTLATTYHYIAICDPAARFFLAAADTHNSSASVLPKTQALPIAGWTQVFALTFQELLNNTSTDGSHMKSTGLTAAGVVPLVANAETANALTFGVGEIIERIGLNSATFEQLSYLFGRLDDGNGPFAVPPFGVATWTGDGTASRSVSVNLGGKRPVWAMCNGNPGYQRDPSHAGSNSTRFTDGVEAATGITGGGIDTVSVGAGLNSNGVPYVLFVLPGSATAGNNGWSIDGEFWPIEPDSPIPDGGWVEPVLLDNEGDDGSGDGDTSADNILDLENATVVGSAALLVNGQYGGQVCEVYSLRVANIALSRIGTSKRLTDIITDTSEAASVVRTHFIPAVNAVLRDFCWPFATRYAELELVDGSETDPVNNDWVYSYRAPDAMMMARRIAVVGIGRRSQVVSDVSTAGVTSTAAWPSNVGRGEPFREATDATGALIYCNKATSDDEPLVLEYTTRIGCTTFFGDALYRDALAWRLAAELALPLARDGKRAEFCLEMYGRVLPKAQTVAGNEQQQEPDGDADWIAGR